jgi:hypothetical protein
MKRTITPALVVLAALSLAGCDQAPKKTKKAQSEIEQSSALLFPACDIAPAAQHAAVQNRPDTGGLRDGIVLTIEGLREARRLSETSFAATGFGSDIFTGAGWPVNAVREALKPAINNIALSQIVELKKAGVCLKPITVSFMRLLADTVAGLDPLQPDEAFQKATYAAEDYFTKLLADLDRIPTPEGARAELARRKAALADAAAAKNYSNGRRAD